MYTNLCTEFSFSRICILWDFVMCFDTSINRRNRQNKSYYIVLHHFIIGCTALQQRFEMFELNQDQTLNKSNLLIWIFYSDSIWPSTTCMVIFLSEKWSNKEFATFQEIGLVKAFCEFVFVFLSEPEFEFAKLVSNMYSCFVLNATEVVNSRGNRCIYATARSLGALRAPTSGLQPW